MKHICKVNTIIISATAGAVLFFLGVVFFAISSFITESVAGLPSSTGCLIFIFILPYAIGISCFGMVAGLLIGCILKMTFKIKQINTKKFMIVFVILASTILVVSTIIGYMVQMKYTKDNTPRIIIDKGVITKKPYDEIINSQIQNFPSSSNDKNKEVHWNNDNIRITFTEHSVNILDSSGNVYLTKSLEGYDYIREVKAMPIKFFNDQAEYLAIIAILRATSFHAILLIYDYEGVLIFQELLEYINCGDKYPLSNFKGEVLILGVESKCKFIYYGVNGRRK